MDKHNFVVVYISINLLYTSNLRICDIDVITNEFIIYIWIFGFTKFVLSKIIENFDLVKNTFGNQSLETGLCKNACFGSVFACF